MRSFRKSFSSEKGVVWKSSYQKNTLIFSPSKFIGNTLILLFSPEYRTNLLLWCVFAENSRESEICTFRFVCENFARPSRAKVGGRAVFVYKEIGLSGWDKILRTDRLSFGITTIPILKATIGEFACEKNCTIVLF